MGEVKAHARRSCKTIALRYRFVLNNQEDGKSELQFLPHELIKLEVDVSKEPTPEPEPEVVYVDDVEYLRSLDPKEWKKQDHYKVLGIEPLRIKATEEIIKTAYRKMVLKHHPDKRKAQGEEILQDDDYFTCITMAYETLGNPVKRKSYDSVDPEFDDNIPTTSEIKKDFYKVFDKYFQLNSRWSERKKVPKIGNADATRDEVDHFYSFWYDFKSWREYSYEDEEDKDKCTDRDERRYVDKLNKAERLRKKKEENSRIRQLVDLAYNNDPRIIKFRQEDKDKKLAIKKAKQTAAQAKRDEEERVLREAQQAKEKAEAAERAKIEAKRQEREALKRVLKREKKTLRDFCKSHDYFVTNPDDNLKHLTALERLCEYLTVEELGELNKNLKNNGKSAFMKAIKENDAKIEAERMASTQTYQQRISEQVKNNVVKVNPEWTNDNIQLLIKAVNLFPAGTNQRWEVVANFLNQHGTISENSSNFTAKLVLAKAKDLQNTDFSKNNMKEAANKEAFNTFVKEKKATVNVKDTEISKKDGKKEAAPKVAASKVAAPKVTPPTPTPAPMTNGDATASTWSKSEQQLLEQALKTYPSSTAERWDRIAECIPNRSKKDCMKRYKELVETIKAKKAAQANLNSK